MYYSVSNNEIFRVKWSVNRSKYQTYSSLWSFYDFSENLIDIHCRTSTRVNDKTCKTDFGQRKYELFHSEVLSTSPTYIAPISFIFCTLLREIYTVIDQRLCKYVTFSRSESPLFSSDKICLFDLIQLLRRLKRFGVATEFVFFFAQTYGKHMLNWNACLKKIQS